MAEFDETPEERAARRHRAFRLALLLILVIVIWALLWDTAFGAFDG